MTALNIQIQLPTGELLKSVPLTRAIRPVADVLVSQVGDELVLLELDSEHYFGLDAMGRSMWEKLTTSANIAVAIAALLAEYEVDEPRLLQDVARLLGELVSRRLVELRDAPTG